MSLMNCYGLLHCLFSERQDDMCEKSVGMVRSVMKRRSSVALFLPVVCSLLAALSAVCAAEGSALKFDGTDDRVDVATALVSDDITMSAWVKADTPWVNDARVIISNSYWGAAANRVGFHLQFTSSGSVASRYQTQADGVGVWSATSTTKPAGAWHHLTYVKAGTKVSVVVDGKEEGSLSNMPASITGLAVQDRIRIGCHTGNARLFPGIIDEVRIWNYALTLTEIQEGMTHELRGTEKGLVGYWKFNEGQGTKAFDSASIPHDGTLVNGPTWVTETAPITSGPLPLSAFAPSPAAGAVDVPRDIALSWKAGGYADKHDVYLGTTFADVNTASRTAPNGVLVSQGQAETTFDPAGVFAYGQTYYWRIDEVNKAPDNTIFKGAVWSFAVEPYGYSVRPVMATASSAQTGMGPEKTIDRSGLTGDLHGTEPTSMWLSAGVQPNWIQYEFDKVYKLHELQVWNSNQLVESVVGFSAKNVTIETSIEGTTWTPVANVPEFARGPGAASYAANTTVSLGLVDAKYVKLTINANWGGVAPQTGLAEVRFSSVPVQARGPQPANAAKNVGVDTSLDWRPGRLAASHQVYFGTDPNAVATGTAAAKSLTGHGYSPGVLNLGTTYYWKVDEVNAAVTCPGDVWSFTTQEYKVVEDFESYTDKAGAEIFSTWIDGFADSFKSSGSIVGLDTAAAGTFCETTIIHSGRQSMPVRYDNTKAPISEAIWTFDSPQDWTANGVKSLSLWFYGAAGNGGQLYLKVNSTKIAYDGDAANLARTAWQVWNLDLSKAGNVSSVRSLTIGIEGAGAKGTLYVDDIRLYPKTPEYITPVQLAATGLAAYYTFDEGSGTTAKDTSGNGNNGTINGNPQWVAGKIGGALSFDGAGNYVDCGKGASLVIRDAITISCWIKIASFTRDWETILGMGDDSYRMSRSATNGNSIHFGCNGPTGGNLDANTVVNTDTWRHVALVYDGTNKIIYIDGLEDARVASTGRINASAYNLYIGANSQQANRNLKGVVDDVRIYNRPLSAAEVAGLAGLTQTLPKPF